MTSPKHENSPRGWPKPEELVPVLSDEVKERSVGGIFKIDTPNQIPYQFPFDGHKPIPSIQLKCQSLLTQRPNIVACCNSTVKTIIGGGSGDQVELIECGRCRTSYLVRTHYDEGDPTPHIDIRVWDTGRNVKKYTKMKRDKNQDVWVEFNK